MPHRPSVVVFDVNGTLSDMAPLGGHFADLGLPPETARAWFASVLRDGFALTVAGSPGRFADIAAENLRRVLAGAATGRSVDEAIDHAMSAFTGLSVHPDVPEGIRSLRAAGLRLVTLSVGSSQVARTLLESAGLADEFDALLSVEDSPTGTWKPAPAAYQHALDRCGVPADDAVLAAAHPWDVDGAARAGLATAWVDREGSPYPSHFTPPDHTVTALTELPTALIAA